MNDHSLAITKETIQNWRKGADDASVANMAYKNDPAFRAKVDQIMARSAELDSFTRSRLPTLLLNKQYFNTWELDQQDEQTASMAQQVATTDPTKPRTDVFGTLSQLGDQLKQRNQAAWGTDTGFMDLGHALPGGEPWDPTPNPNSALGRMAMGKQGLGETTLQVGGQGAGLIGDITGAGLKLGGKLLSAITPDAIEKPVVDSVKAAGLSLLQTPLGQAGVKALQQGMEYYDQWKNQHPSEAANLESVVNIASIVPVGKAGQFGKGAIAKVAGPLGVDDIATKGSNALKESAEASVSRVLNPTTKATKQTTQKLAPELVKRPLKDTLSLTRKGMERKASEAADIAGQAIDAAGPLPGTSKTAELINYLESQKQAFAAGGKIVNEEGVKSVDNVIQIISQYGDDIDDDTLRAVRRIFDTENQAAKKNFSIAPAEASKLEMKKRAANKIRGILADKYPDIDKLNKEYTFWANLEDVLSQTTTRKTGQKGAIKAVATVGGAVAGQGIAGSIAGALAFRTVASLVDSPAWGFVSAKLKNRLADALANRDLSDIGKILSILPGQAAINAVPDTE